MTKITEYFYFQDKFFELKEKEYKLLDKMDDIWDRLTITEKQELKKINDDNLEYWKYAGSVLDHA